ncbi:MAG: hypothetical protein ACFE8B_06360 [Candidatus Hermodarchaeota archaeon]
MSIFRADLYLRIRITDFNLIESSEKLFMILKTVSSLRNVQMTKVRKDEELHGRMVIKEWYEITGSIDVPEGSKSFWVLSKEISENEPYNIFVRIDRNIEAEDYEIAQKKAHDWVSQEIIEPIKKQVSTEKIELDSPVEFSKTVNLMRVSN